MHSYTYYDIVLVVECRRHVLGSLPLERYRCNAAATKCSRKKHQISCPYSSMDRAPKVLREESGIRIKSVANVIYVSQQHRHSPTCAFHREACIIEVGLPCWRMLVAIEEGNETGEVERRKN